MKNIKDTFQYLIQGNIDKLFLLLLTKKMIQLLRGKQKSCRRLSMPNFLEKDRSKNLIKQIANLKKLPSMKDWNHL